MGLSNNKIKYIQSLKEKKFRNKYNTFVAEGTKLVLDLLESCKCQLIAALPEVIYANPELRAEEIIEASPNELKKATFLKTPPSIIAVFYRHDSEIDKSEIKNKLSLVLDGVQDPGNVGTIIRTAAAADILDIYLINCADPYSPKTIRSTMGGIFFTRIYEIDYTFLDELERVSIILGADMQGTTFQNYNRTRENISLAIGNEANGLSEIVRKKCKGFLSIPMKNTESLNAAVSAGILMYYLKSKEF